MQRRDLLGVLASAAASTGLTPAQLAAAARGPRPGAARVFAPPQATAVARLADLIIPPTDTPGAAQAGVAGFIETIVSEWYTVAERERFLRGLADVDARAQALAGVPFAAATEAQQVAILTGLEAEGRALRQREANAPTPFFHRFRGLVLHGYYTSEVGLRAELAWLPVPGRFDGCVDLPARPAPGPGGA